MAGTNNLNGPRIGGSQSANQHVTANDAVNAVDAAMTDGVTIGVTNTNAYTLTSAEIRADFHFIIGVGATSPSAAVTISLPASIERGLTFWRNSLAYPATIRKVTSQTEPVVVIPPGGAVLIEYDGSNARLVNYLQPFFMSFAISDESNPLTAGTGKISFRMPARVWLTEVRASLVTAQSTGSALTFDVNEAGTSILSTKLIFDNGQDSTGSIAQSGVTITTLAVISDNALADNAKVTVDIDQVGDGTAVGGKVTFIGYRY